MSTEPVASTASVSFPVKYQTVAAYNRDLAGKGRFTMRDGAFVFTGKPRGTLFHRGQAEVVIGTQGIRNVTRSGTAVTFATPVGRSGVAHAPFLVVCSSVADAEALVALLPVAKDANVVEVDAFQAKLNALSTSASPIASVTHVIVALNVVAFVVMGLLGAGWLDTADMHPYIAYAANNAAATTDGEWWRLITAMFAHYGVIHLLLNMWALFQAGHLVEKLFGRALYTMVYLGSGIIGGLATLAWHGDRVWSAGASGAIFGVYGALLGYLWREKHGMPKSMLLPLMKSTLTFAGYNLVYGTIHPQIDNVAHLGGLVGGVGLGWICALPLDRDVRASQTARRLTISGAAVLGAFIVGFAIIPRYDYVVREELRWADANKSRVAEEQALLTKGQKVLSAIDGPGGEAPARVWLRDEAIPFYSTWRNEVRALPLDPNRRTAKRRDELVRIFDLKVKSYADFNGSPRLNDPAALSRYSEAQKEIAAAIGRIGKMNGKR